MVVPRLLAALCLATALASGCATRPPKTPPPSSQQIFTLREMFLQSGKTEEQYNESMAYIKEVTGFQKMDLDPFLKASELTLYSLHPVEVEPPSFHGYQILGKTTVKASPATEQALKELRDKTNSILIEDRGMVAGLCFAPRHGILAECEDAKYTLLICYQCHWCYVYREADSKMTRKEFVFDDLEPTILNALLDAADVPRDHPDE